MNQFKFIHKNILNVNFFPTVFIYLVLEQTTFRTKYYFGQSEHCQLDSVKQQNKLNLFL